MTNYYETDFNHETMKTDSEFTELMKYKERIRKNKEVFETMRQNKNKIQINKLPSRR